jgi:hypothetical protein
MGLLSSLMDTKTLRQIATGGLRQVGNTIIEAREQGEEYLTTLAAAREDVNTEGKIIGDNYNKALRVMEGTGNTAFNNFLYTQMAIDQIAGLADLAPTTKDQQLKQLKFQFESLKPEEKASYEKGNYVEEAKAAYNQEIDNLKIKKGLVNSSGTGENTIEALITTGVKKKQKTEEDKIISQAITPEIDVPQTTEGEGIYGSIGETAFEDSRLKLMIDQDYIDGTIEELIRNRLIISNEIYNTTAEQIQNLVNEEYNNQVKNAKRIFLSQGDDLIVTTKVEVDDTNIDSIINPNT